MFVFQWALFFPPFFHEKGSRCLRKPNPPLPNCLCPFHVPSVEHSLISTTTEIPANESIIPITLKHQLVFLIFLWLCSVHPNFHSDTLNIWFLQRPIGDSFSPPEVPVLAFISVFGIIHRNWPSLSMDSLLQCILKSWVSSQDPKEKEACVLLHHSLMLIQNGWWEIWPKDGLYCIGNEQKTYCALCSGILHCLPGMETAQSKRGKLMTV